MWVFVYCSDSQITNNGLNPTSDKRKMGLYKYIKKLWKQPKANLGDLYKQKIIQWRKEPVTVRIEFPTRLDKARAIGYKAKQGYILVRQRVSRGSHKRPNITGGRRSAHTSQKMVLHLSYQTICEQRASKAYPNLEVLNSYFVAKDGQHYWYEIILVDRAHPVITNDPKINWICEKRGRAFTGQTSSARKSRGLRHKGVGTEKVRPSANANKGRIH
ncbi:MAG: large subunit ribosomal protein L15e [Candidatus Woesearchaeota archaeon]|jgi:large subunit ribosomal protein L15e